MKKIFILICILFCSVISSFATNYTWTGATSAVATTSTNWSPNGVPSFGDNVLFDGTSVLNCTWNISQVNSFSVMAGYAGVITMSSGNRTYRQNFVVNSGTVISTSGSLIRSVAGVGGSFILGASGTFSNNGGTFVLQLEGSDSYSFSGNIVFSTLTIAGVLNSPVERFVNFGSNLVTNTLNYSVLLLTPDPVSYQGTVHIKSSLDMTNTGNTDILSGTNNANFIFDGATANIIGTSASGMAFLPNVQINTTGNYTMTNFLNVSGNWTATQGTLVPGSSETHFYGASSSISGSGVPAFHSLVVESGAALSLPAAEVMVGGDLTVNGTLTAQSTTTLGLNSGNTNQTLSGSGSSLAFAAVHAYTGSRTVTMSKAVRILDFLQVDAGVTFAAGGNVTLNSNSTLSARVAPLSGGASITGNVTVETLIPGGATGWANLGTPGVDNQTVGSWDTYVSSGGTTGLPMTCSLCAYSPSVLPAWFNSIQTWNEPTDTYDSITVNTPLVPGQGFWVYVGDGAISTNDLKLVNTGALVQGNVSIMTTAQGTFDISNGNFAYYNLVANPYPSPISWGSVLSNNAVAFNDAIYAFNADVGDFASYVFGVSTNGLNDVLPGGQGFYIENNSFGGAAVNLDFHETDKIASSGAPPLVRPAATSSVGQVFHLKLIGTVDQSETAIRIHSDATNAFDRHFDARKQFVSPGYQGYPGSYSKYTTVSTKDAFGLDYSIQSLPPLTQSLSIPLLTRVSGSGTYTLHAFDFQDFNSCVGVIDHVNNSYHDLKAGDYVFSINDTTSAPRFDLVLCRDAAANPDGIAEQLAKNSQILIGQDASGAYVRTGFSQNTKATISVYNVIGQKLMSDIQVEGTITSTRIPLDQSNQVVLIRVASDKEIATKRLITH